MEKKTIEVLNGKASDFTTKNQDEFNELLHNISITDAWLNIPINHMKMSVIPAGSKQEEVFMGANSNVLEEAHRKGALKLSDGTNNFILNELALFTLKDRAGLTCDYTTSLLNEKEYAKFCDVMNTAFPYYDKDSKVLVRAGQVLAAHSSNYVPLSQEDIFQSTQNKILKNFPDATFESGNYTHKQTSVYYTLSDYKADIMELYRDAWTSAGYSLTDLEATHPMLKVSTSDVGMFCVEIAPTLLQDRFIYPLGEKIKIKHNGTADIRSIQKGLDLVYSKLQEGLTATANMLSTPISFPVATMIRAAKQTGLLKSCKKIVRNIVDTYKTCLCPGLTFTAYDLYIQLCEIQYNSGFDKLSPLTQLKIQENLSRLLVFDWAGNDAPGDEEV